MSRSATVERFEAHIEFGWCMLRAISLVRFAICACTLVTL